MPFSAKSCITGPRGSSCRSGPSVSGPPLRTESRSARVPRRGSSRFSSHFTCTRPLPFALLNDAPPLRSSTTFGSSIILKLPEAVGNWKAGETATLSLAFSFRASTVQETQNAPSRPSSVRTAVCVVVRSSSGWSGKEPSGSATSASAGLAGPGARQKSVGVLIARSRHGSPFTARSETGGSKGASNSKLDIGRSGSSSCISAWRSAGSRLQGRWKSAAKSSSSEVTAHADT
mmetsp:Transcript_37112/g.100436  ORF Transcript_37112/g.100436 Transcript_37112/m.100436 type:complete len:232 (-) Transcript_37112:115-810(-)